jgi:hypothetical protein
MPWYCAHIVMYEQQRRPHRKNQCYWLAWENVVLIKARNRASAHTKAEAIGRASEIRDDPHQTYMGKLSDQVFGGIRAIVDPECQELAHGVELTYLSFVMKSRRDLRKLIAGKDVRLTYEA